MWCIDDNVADVAHIADAENYEVNDNAHDDDDAHAVGAIYLHTCLQSS